MGERTEKPFVTVTFAGLKRKTVTCCSKARKGKLAFFIMFLGNEHGCVALSFQAHGWRERKREDLGGG